MPNHGFSQSLLYLNDSDISRFKNIRLHCRKLWDNCNLSDQIIAQFGPLHSAREEIIVANILRPGNQSTRRLDNYFGSDILLCMLVAVWLKYIGFALLANRFDLGLGDREATSIATAKKASADYLLSHQSELGLSAEELETILRLLRVDLSRKDPAQESCNISDLTNPDEAVIAIADVLDMSVSRLPLALSGFEWKKLSPADKWNWLRQWCVLSAEPHHEKSDSQTLILTYRLIIRLPKLQYKPELWDHIMRPIIAVNKAAYSALIRCGITLLPEQFKCIPLLCDDPLTDGTSMTSAFEDVLGPLVTSSPGIANSLEILKQENFTIWSVLEKQYRSVHSLAIIPEKDIDEVDSALDEFFATIAKHPGIESIDDAREDFRATISALLNKPNYPDLSEFLKIAELGWRLAMLLDRNEAKRAAQLAYLSQLLGSEISEVLEWMSLNDSSVDVKRIAIERLAEKGSPDCYDTLLKATRDNDESIRTAAVLGLRRLNGPGCYSRLAEILEVDVSGRVRRAAADVLGAIIDKNDLSASAGHRVLVLDDDQAHISLLVDALEKRGVEVKVVTDSEKIGDALDGWTPRVAVCNLDPRKNAENKCEYPGIGLASIVNSILGYRVQLVALSKQDPGSLLTEANLRCVCLRIPTTVDYIVGAIESLLYLGGGMQENNEHELGGRISWGVLTPLPEEFIAFSKHMKNVTNADDQILPTKIGTIGLHSVACILTGKGEGNTASALNQLSFTFQPRWILLSGVAGGFPERDFRRGDVIIGRFIYDMDFGKYENNRYLRRPEYDYGPDRALLSHAELLASNKSSAWQDRILESRPDGRDKSESRAQAGYIASSDKIIDDPSNKFFEDVKATIPEVDAVEMEAAGAGAAVRLAQARQTLGFLMVRGISDEVSNSSQNVSGRNQRKVWKEYAADVSAAFIESLLITLPATFGKRHRVQA